MRAETLSHHTNQPIQMVPVEPNQSTAALDAWYDPYSPVAIILAVAALVTAIGKVVGRK